VVFSGELRFHADHLHVDGFVLKGPAAALGEGAVDHAFDDVLFDAIAGAEADHVAGAKVVVVVNVFVVDDVGGGAETVPDGVAGGAGLSGRGGGACALLRVGPVSGEALGGRLRSVDRLNIGI
jgi:hypothetical protein